jgi:putative transcriptional regulator
VYVQNSSSRDHGGTARERVSQAVFARYLNVTTGLISQWERGEKRPAGASLKLLNLVDRRGLAAIA